MPQTPKSCFAYIADNNQKVDQTIDGIVGSALKNESIIRPDIVELKKTVKLLLISDLTSGGTDPSRLDD